eukprot:c45473_g1_i1 orf=2-205(-)
MVTPIVEMNAQSDPSVHAYWGDSDCGYEHTKGSLSLSLNFEMSHLLLALSTKISPLYSLSPKNTSLIP